jgi:hypothetical protein
VFSEELHIDLNLQNCFSGIMADMMEPSGKVNPKKFELINGVLWAKKEVKRAKRTPGTALGDAAVLEAAAASGAGNAGNFDDADVGEGNINEAYNPQKSTLSLEERFEVCKGVAVECIQVWLWPLRNMLGCFTANAYRNQSCFLCWSARRTQYVTMDLNLLGACTLRREF